MKSLSKHKIQNDTTSSLHSSAIKYSLRFLFLVLSILNLGLSAIIQVIRKSKTITSPRLNYTRRQARSLYLIGEPPQQRSRINLRFVIMLALVPLMLASCTSHESRQKRADELATNFHFTPHVIKAGKFLLHTYQKVQNPNQGSDCYQHSSMYSLITVKVIKTYFVTYRQHIIIV